MSLWLIVLAGASLRDGVSNQPGRAIVHERPHIAWGQS